MVPSQPSRPEPEYTALTKRIFPDLNTLFEAGEEVRSLQTHPGWTHVQALITAQIEQIDAEMDGRLLDDRADYAWRHGKRHGLHALAEAARAIVGEADKRLAEQQRKHEGAAESALNGAT